MVAARWFLERNGVSPRIVQCWILGEELAHLILLQLSHSSSISSNKPISSAVAEMGWWEGDLKFWSMEGQSMRIMCELNPFKNPTGFHQLRKKRALKSARFLECSGCFTWQHWALTVFFIQLMTYVFAKFTHPQFPTFFASAVQIAYKKMAAVSPKEINFELTQFNSLLSSRWDSG